MSQATQQKIHVVATSHGTDNANGQQLIHDLRADLERRSEERFPVQLVWHEAYVDVQEPRLETVIAGLPEGEPAVVLPLLVSDGVHTTHDIAQAVSSRAGTSAALPLGPLPELAQVLAQRAAGHLANDPLVVLATAGTRLEVGQNQVKNLAEQLAVLLEREVQVGYCAGAQPRIADVVGNAAARPVLVLSSLLADGFFQQKLASTGAGVVTSPLLPDVMIAQCFLVRLQKALEEELFMSPDDEVLTR
ncbi:MULTISPECIES: sirohydrochlorin chelatase [unclassified Glutamicibacter]|uniref:sirohydrochlorin chelatase n=1 Tax=unclassified Glutamicibacter TaxID=2627139 RepID=UPI003821E716